MKYLVETLLKGVEVKSFRLNRTPDANGKVKPVIKTKWRITTANLERAQQQVQETATSTRRAVGASRAARLPRQQRLF